MVVVMQMEMGVADTSDIDFNFSPILWGRGPWYFLTVHCISVLAFVLLLDTHTHTTVPAKI